MLIISYHLRKEEDIYLVVMARALHTLLLPMSSLTTKAFNYDRCFIATFQNWQCLFKSFIKYIE